MQSKPKRNSVITTRLDGTILVFGVIGVGDIRFDPAKAHADNRAHAERHGWFQRIPDAAALARDTATGLPATAQAKYDRMRAVVAHYESGSAEWSRKAAPSERPIDVGLVVMALMRAYPDRVPSVENANARIDKMALTRGVSRDDAARVWLETKEVASAMSAILAERLSSGESLLDDGEAEEMSEEETAE